MNGNFSSGIGISVKSPANDSSLPLSKKIKGRDSGAGFPFEEKLIKAESKVLLEKLDNAADKLFRFPSQRVLDEYKSIVRELLEQAQGMLAIRQEFSMASGAAFKLITRVQEGLSQLERVLSREGKRTKIMKLTDEIKGCLVSLLV